MNVTQKLYISQKECFNTLVSSAIYDVKNATGKTLQVRKLEGYKYQRTMSNGALATTKIVKVQPNELYQFETSSRVNTHTTTYTIKSTSETTCEVTYNELIETEKALNKMNNIIVGFMFGFFRKKRVKNLLKSIELSVINESKQKQEKLAAKSEQ
ncbi:DUF3284 domain-containing protein [Listeria monocytogenes serotype 1/2a]|nr:DUF3284 domain-containing protein [Listeria monocytogenes serotype 1/2a]